MVTRSIQLTHAHELQKILPDTTRHVTVHLNNEFLFCRSLHLVLTLFRVPVITSTSFLGFSLTRPLETVVPSPFQFSHCQRAYCACCVASPYTVIAGSVKEAANGSQNGTTLNFIVFYCLVDVLTFCNFNFVL